MSSDNIAKIVRSVAKISTFYIELMPLRKIIDIILRTGSTNTATSEHAQWKNCPKYKKACFNRWNIAVF